MKKIKEKFAKYIDYANKPLIACACLVTLSLFVVCIYFITNDNPTTHVGTEPESYTKNEYTGEESSTISNQPTDTTINVTTEIPSTEKPTEEPTTTTSFQLVTKPLEEISTTKDNSNMDEVMGGDDNYGGRGDDEEEEEELPSVSKPTETKPPATTEEPTTEAPTTEAPTTEAPTTEAPTTEAPTTEAPTTEAPTTEAPTTEAPTTEAPTTETPTTEPSAEQTTPDTSTTEGSTTTNSGNNDVTTEESTSSENTTIEEITTEEPTTEEPTTEQPTTPPPSSVAIKKPSDFILDVTYGIDVSKWQGDIDWAKVKAYGVDFAIIKLGGRGTDDAGEIYMDSKFEQNIKGALENDIKVGVYFFSQAISMEEIIEEISYILAVVKDYNITMPICFDFEQGSAANGRRTYKAFANGTLTAELLTEMTCQFCNSIEAAGYESMVYASRSSWRNASKWDGKFLNDTYRTWLAVYYGGNKKNPKDDAYYLPNFGTGNSHIGEFKQKYYVDNPTFTINSQKASYQMWQYSEEGIVDGIDGYVDLNMCFYIKETYDGYESPLRVEVDNSQVITYVNKTVNLLDGVRPINTLQQVKALSDMTYTIENELGATFSISDAVKNAGTYKVTYCYSDFTGCYRYNYATLTVYPTEEEYSSAYEELYPEETTEEITTEVTTTEEITTEEVTTEEATTEANTTEDSTTEDSTTENSTTTDNPTGNSNAEDSTT